MVKMGKLFKKNFGNVRFRDKKKRQVDIKKIEMQQTETEISLDEAIKKEQQRRKQSEVDIANKKKALRDMRIALLKKRVKQIGRGSLRVGRGAVRVGREIQKRLPEE